MSSNVKNVLYFLLAFFPAIIVLGSLSFAILLTNNSKVAGVANTSIPLSPPPSRLSYPDRLIIPSIGIDAAIQKVGISSSGEMEVPPNSTDVGWYDISQKMTRFGGAVISGHLNNERGEPGVFSLLKNLKFGDPVYIKDSVGRIYTFITQNQHQYSPDENNDVFLENTEVSIKLVTCDGGWNNEFNTYNQRLVVSAVLASE